MIMMSCKCISEPVSARAQMVSAGAGGAAAAAPVLAHNLGMLLMYLAAHARLRHRYPAFILYTNKGIPLLYTYLAFFFSILENLFGKLKNVKGVSSESSAKSSI